MAQKILVYLRPDKALIRDIEAVLSGTAAS